MIKDEEIKAICNSTTSMSYVETIPMMNINIVEVTEDIGTPMAQKEMREIRRSQREDWLIDRWRRAVIDKRVPHNNMGKEDMIFKKQFSDRTRERSLLVHPLCNSKATLPHFLEQRTVLRS